MKGLSWTALFLTLAPTAHANEAFVEANILGIFCHELGHAVIDTEGSPVFGQEEDAAGIFSILLIDAFWADNAAEDMAWHAATGFWAEAALCDEGGTQIASWGVHSPDVRRFYNTVCLFYRAAPETRSDFAEAWGLPEDRAEICADEFRPANESW